MINTVVVVLFSGVVISVNSGGSPNYNRPRYANDGGSAYSSSSKSYTFGQQQFLGVVANNGPNQHNPNNFGGLRQSGANAAQSNSKPIWVYRKIQYRSATQCRDEHPPHVNRMKYPNYCENIGAYVNRTGDISVCYAHPGASLCWCRKSCGACEGFQCEDTNRPGINCLGLQHLCQDPAWAKLKCLCPKTCGNNCEDLSAACCANQVFVM